MKLTQIILLGTAVCSMVLISCSEKTVKKEEAPFVNFKDKEVTGLDLDSAVIGKTYLSVYSDIYSQNETRLHKLTATISVRNPSGTDTLLLTSANYYGTSGEKVRSFITNPIRVLPMETIEIVLDRTDEKGGTGANFVFHWVEKEDVEDPIFEAVMISTSGQQGISFVTQGVRLK